MNLRAFALRLAVIALLGVGTSARSQSSTTTTPTTTTTTPTTSTNGVIIYELSFKHVAGFNVDFYEGGYVVVPATGGGKGSAIFTAMDSGKKVYWKFADTVNFYPAKTDDDRYTVISLAGGSDAVVGMLAYGKANHTIKINNTLFSLSLHAAESLRGMAQASRDESSPTKQPKDGTIGFVEFSEMKLNLDERETDRSNDKAESVSTAFTRLETKLKGKGYVDAAGSTTTTTDPGTGTTTTNPLGSGTGPLTN